MNYNWPQPVPRHLGFDDVEAAARLAELTDLWIDAGCDLLPSGPDCMLFATALDIGVDKARALAARCADPAFRPYDFIHDLAHRRLGWKLFGAAHGEKVGREEAAAIRMTPDCVKSDALRFADAAARTKGFHQGHAARAAVLKQLAQEI